MRISNQIPTIYWKIKEKFPINWDMGVVIAYGDTVYTKAGEIDDAHKAHEQVHLNRQGKNPNFWWERYLSDKTFRFEEEKLAYQAQARYYRDNIQNNSKRRREIEHLASDMEKYYKMCSFEEALQCLT